MTDDLRIRESEGIGYTKGTRVRGLMGKKAM